jgi:hypothetical protein
LAELTLILVAVEISVQNLMKEIRGVSKLKKDTPSKNKIIPGNSNEAPPLFLHSPRSKGGPVTKIVTTDEAANPNGKTAPVRLLQNNKFISKKQKIREAVKEGCNFLSPNQRARVRKAAIGFTGATEMLIKDASKATRLLFQENIPRE